MRNYKKVLIMTLVFCALLNKTYAQDLVVNENYLTIQEFNDLTFDNVKLGKIDYTKGNVTKMEELFSNTQYTVSDFPEQCIVFSHQGLEILFKDLEQETGTSYELASIKIVNNLSSITIRGYSLTIGSSVSELGNVSVSTYRGNKYILFKLNVNTVESIIIDFDEANNTITGISYNVT